MNISSVLLPFFFISSLLQAGPTPRDYWPTKEWKISKAESQGVDSDKLEELSAFIQEELPMTTSMLLVRHGYIVQEYYALNDPEKLRDLWSVTKGVLSALTGIALRKGHIESIELPIIGFFPEYSSSQVNPKSKGILIRHLLTMSSGLSSEEMSSTVRPDLFSKSLRNDPGAEFFYNGIDPQLLSMILTKTTGMSAHDFAKKQLFERLGISSTSWSINSVGGTSYSEGGYGLRMTTRDLAKFGYLYLNNGWWEDVELVPIDWVSYSTSRQFAVPESLWYYTRDYGFYWWIRSVDKHGSFAAIGWQGQYLYLIPDLDIVIVITALDEENEAMYLKVIDKYIFPAIKD